MLTKPNKTILRGRVEAIHPEKDGWGADIELLVAENESVSEEEDFLRPAPGSIIRVFSAEPEKLKVGDQIRAQATLLAGPTGGRAVLESVTPIKKSASPKS